MMQGETKINLIFPMTSNSTLVKETQDTVIQKDYDTSWIIISNVINTQFLEAEKTEIQSGKYSLEENSIEVGFGGWVKSGLQNGTGGTSQSGTKVKKQKQRMLLSVLGLECSVSI